jgi:hypothetical protein
MALSPDGKRLLPQQRRRRHAVAHEEDRAPEHLLDEAIWKSVRGAQSPMPAPRHRAR